ncbi:hypothetical protein ACSBL2_24920 [Pedobacter sp. AW31-3R]|uniref:hypothetical protein n=1 Tax=Pedobacter sp. AW31-3R TaxID=3445781 RepID=UPI003FA02E99
MTEAVITVTDELDIPVKDDFTGDIAGSIALGSANRIKIKGTDLQVRELTNIEDLSASSVPSFSNTIFTI